jgi:molybdopterin molybdotransferase
MRARFDNSQLIPFDRQDSALLTVLVHASALLVRAPHAPAQTKGTLAPYLVL